MPKVSVILTSYNHAKYIYEAIASVLAQTFADFELIIFDDASSDNSWQIIKSFDDLRIKAFRNEQRRRGIWGINKAISELAVGEYIAIHHSDDIWEADKLERQVAFLNSHSCIGAVFTNALAIGEDSLPLNNPEHFYSDIFEQPNRSRHEWLNFFFHNGNALCHPSVLIRKECFSVCGPYRTGTAQTTDFDMWVRLCMKYEIHVIREKLVRFRVLSNEANTSGSRPDSRIRVQIEFYQILKNYLNIASFEELNAIFPEATKYYRAEGFDLKFILGMIALEKKPFPFAELFGIELLYKAVADPDRAGKIKTLYNFDYLDLIDLAGKHDIFSIEKLIYYPKVFAEKDLTIAERDDKITTLRQTIAEYDETINNLKTQAEQQSGLIAEQSGLIAEQSALISQITSSLSWKLTRPLRFAGRLLRGEWGLAFSRFHATNAGADSVSNNSKSRPALTNKTAEGQCTAVTATVDGGGRHKSFDLKKYNGKRILLVSYYCPTRAHAGGLRILDIYSLIKAESPDIRLDLYTFRRPDLDWSYTDVETIFDNVFYSDSEGLSPARLAAKCPNMPFYDIIDLQFHPSARYMDEFRIIGAKILFTPMESLVRAFSIDLKDAVRHARLLSIKKMALGIKHSIEEIRYSRKADEVICVSKPDANLLQKISLSRKIRYLESGLSHLEFKDALETNQPTASFLEKDNAIAYVAFFGSETNILALKWYLTQVHHLVKEKAPDYKLYVVGRGDLSVVAGYQDEAVILVGEVPSIGPYINISKLGIAPALGGAGLRGKMTQYAIYGVPTVASPIAVEGSMYKDGVDIYIAEDPAVFADRCIVLLKDQEINERIAGKARQTALQNYTWKSKMSLIRDVYSLECGKTAKKPKVTALIPSYNHAAYLQKRIESIVRQTYSDIELIVIDDFSNDNSDEIIKSLQSKYGFLYSRNTCNSGSPFSAWERGMTMGTGDYIWICESDDFAEPEFLESMVDALLQNKGSVMAYCDSWVVDCQDKRIGHTDSYFHDIWRETRWDSDFVNSGTDELKNYQLRGQTVPNMSSALFSMEAFRRAYSPFLNNFRLTGDWLFVGWVLKYGNAVYCKRTLSNFRKHDITARVRVKSARSQAEYIVTKYILFRISGRDWREFSVTMATDALRFLYEPAGLFDVLQALLRISFFKTVQCGALFVASLPMNGHLVRKFWQRYNLVKGDI